MPDCERWLPKFLRKPDEPFIESVELIHFREEGGCKMDGVLRSDVMPPKSRGHVQGGQSQVLAVRCH